MKKKVLISVFILLSLLGCLPISELRAQIVHAPRELLVAPDSDVQADPNFQWILEKEKNGLPTESAKIEYLLDRIRESSYDFIRNGIMHSPQKAAEHLAWKYSFARDRVKTADQFILYLATKSLKTGLPYMIKLPNGVLYPCGDILSNELNRLESYLSGTSENQAAVEISLA
jgi:hypothetical protein